MMRKMPKVLFVSALCAVFCACSSCQKGGKSNVNGENSNDSMEVVSDSAVATSSYVPVRIPSFVRNLFPSSDWYADTICVANGTAYYQGYDDYGRCQVIFTQNKLLLAAPILYISPAEGAERANKVAGNGSKARSKGAKERENTRFRVYNVAKSVVVDFSDAKSLCQLANFSQVLPSFERYRCDTTAKFGKNILYSFVADFPEARVRGGGAIRAWLIRVVERSLAGVGDNGEKKRLKIGQTKSENAQWTPSEILRDNKRVANKAAKAYFAKIKKDNEGLNAEDYPSSLFSGISLQTVIYNERFVTYLVYTNEYNGGAHGYYTEQLASYDYVHHREIDCNYLFRPQYLKDVLALLIDEAKKTPEYQTWQPNIEEFVVIKDKKANSSASASTSETSSSRSSSSASTSETSSPRSSSSSSRFAGKISLPTPGLSDKGVVFSFQPYDISCFAAGTFHFTIPYSRIKPYLTPMAKWCLGLK